MICSMCPRVCCADRKTKVGFCGVGEEIRIARAALHKWEEPCISGKNGSGTVFFSGCSLKCVFCQNYEVSHNSFGKEISEEKLLEIFDSLIEQGAHNINLVTPSHYTLQLVSALERFNSPVPVIWNSSGYENVETLKMLEGLVDVYLPDIKYFDGKISLKYSGAADYPEKAFTAVAEMIRQVGFAETDKNEMIKKGVIIRHLVLPGNVSQTYKILDRVAEEFSTSVTLSLMRQYVPYGKAKEMPPLDRKLSSREYSLAKQRVKELGFEKVYFQKETSAQEIFIPSFNLEGIDL